MVTKAELEVEVAELRKQVADRPEPQKAGGRAVADKLADSGQAADLADKTETEDWQLELQDVLSGLEDLPHKKPLLFALGAFALGYLIGRSR